MSTQDYSPPAVNPPPPATAEALDESPTLGALAAALAKAQGAMANASKDKLNPHFRSRYADLASTWDACREALSSNGLAIIQAPGNVTGGVRLTTTLVHSSGEYVRARFSAPVREQTAQGYGSALTYLRRYSLAAIVGVAPDEDDDGNHASGRPSPPTPQPQPAPQSQPTPQPAKSDQPKTQAREPAKTGGRGATNVKAVLSARRITIQDGPPEPPPLGDEDAPF